MKVIVLKADTTAQTELRAVSQSHSPKHGFWHRSLEDECQKS